MDNLSLSAVFTGLGLVGALLGWLFDDGNWIVTVPILVIIIVLAIVKMDKQEEVNAPRAEPGKAQRA
jgi:uncharacterized membrane protein